jgi:hypothetical protein
MVSTSEREKLRDEYKGENRSALARCCLGLLALALVAAAGKTVDPSDSVIVERVGKERGRLALTSSSMESARATYWGRASSRRVYATTLGRGPFETQPNQEHPREF